MYHVAGYFHVVDISAVSPGFGREKFLSEKLW